MKQDVHEIPIGQGDEKGETLRIVRRLVEEIEQDGNGGYLVVAELSDRGRKIAPHAPEADSAFSFVSRGLARQTLLHIAAAILRKVISGIQKSFAERKDCKCAGCIQEKEDKLALLQLIVRIEHELEGAIGGPEKKVHA